MSFGPFRRNPYDGKRYIKSWFIWRLCELFPGRTFRFGNSTYKVTNEDDE